MAAHARLGASSTKRWMTCPGSVQLIDTLPVKDTAGAAADLGSAAHAFGEFCLLNGVEPWEFLDEPHPVAEFAGKGYTMDADMVDAVTVYTDHIRDLCGRLPGAVVMQNALEQKVSFDTSVVGDWAASMFGTADFLYFDEQSMTLYVRDYKHGAGEGVEVEDNTQMLYYAAAAATQLCAARKMSRGWVSGLTVDIGIIQPRKPHAQGLVRTAVVSGQELHAWMMDVLKPAAEATRVDGALLVYSAGGCLFCPAKAVCPAYTKAITASALLDFADDGTLTPSAPVAALTGDQLARVLDARKEVTSWLDSVETYVKNGLATGVDVTGGLYKLVAGRKTRDWKDEGEAVKFLLSSGVPRDKVVSEKVASPAQAEKLVGKDRIVELAALVKSTEGSPSLVPASDKREALNLSPEADFLN